MNITPTSKDYAHQNYYSSSLRYSESLEEPEPLTPVDSYRGQTSYQAKESAAGSCPRWDLI